MRYIKIKDLGVCGKIKVNPNQSEAIQKELFNMGFHWNIDGQEITDLNKPFLFWDNGIILYATEECEHFFELDELPLHLFENYFRRFNQ